ncbi:Heme response regulator HssR [Posidoniimonas polymericola]|uniref:Heme response regulator HssR n=1 Tax=Posidoniimonas polymericola TaxID=2528002 RepID=A0A5C5ZEX1_9BACT|nr:response regulator [Posidoniimonas polymericola]TWT85391.1 Heme response regulator HssR [Posidoniimonas polymericola]
MHDCPLAFVDDDPTELLLARKYLQRSGLDVPMLEFTSGEAFLGHIDRAAAGDGPMPRVALVDIRMPGMNGFEVLERLRSRPGSDGAPRVVMFSNSDDPRDIERALTSGADDYAVKPDSGEAFLELLQSLVAQCA